MEHRTVTVFGGTGFLGRRIVEALARRGCMVRVAARHPERSGVSVGGVRSITVDVRNGPAVARAVEGAAAVVNAVSLYCESRSVSFDEIHVDAARRVAEAAQEHAVATLVHVSGIGSDPRSPSPYIRARGAGEIAVRDAFPALAVVRPSAMFGPGEGLITALLDVTRLPVVPLFGHGRTRLQPVFVGDVAEAAARLVTGIAHPEATYEVGGPDVLTYRELVELTLRATGQRRPLLPVPFAVWNAMAAVARLLPSPPITEGQVALMTRDNVASLDLPGCRPRRAAVAGRHGPARCLRTGRRLDRQRRKGWIGFWRTEVGLDGFYPFDLVAADLVLEPSDFFCAEAGARVQKGWAPDWPLATPEKNRDRTIPGQCAASRCPDLRIARRRV